MIQGFTYKRIVLLISAALVIATFVAYEPIRHNGFVDFDDATYITRNPNIKNGITLHSITWALTKLYAVNWHPLTWLSHILDYQLFGPNPLGHHLVSLLFHISNALLVLWILYVMTGAIWPSAFVAAVFALHPLQVESVAWAAERKNLLGGFFWLLTTALYIWYAKRPGAGRYILLFLVYGLSIMTKPVVVTLPFALLLLDYWPLGRVKRGNDTKSRNPIKPSAKEICRREISAGWLVMEKIPLFTLSAVLCVITFIAQKSGGAVALLKHLPLNDRIANMFVSYIRYIGKTIWPSRLAVYYPHPYTGSGHTNLQIVEVAVCALLFFMILVLSIYTGRRKRYIAVGWLWFVVTLLPMIGLVQVGLQAMADRYMYISILGLLIIVAWVVKDFIANNRYWKVAAAVSAALVLFTCVTLTRMQVRHWQNSITLFGHTLKVTENNTTAENNYGYALVEADRLDEAVRCLESALKRDPTLAEARINLGLAFRKQGKLNEAIACFNELIQRGQDSAKVYYNLVVALGEQKNYDEAIKCLSKVMTLDPTYPNVQYIMGTLLLSAGRPNEAVAYFNEMLKQNEKPVEAHYNLAVAFGMQKRPDEAIIHFTKVLELDPNYPEVHNKMGLALLETGRINEAVAHLSEALRTSKDLAEVYSNLGTAYSQMGKYDLAIENWTKAAELKPNNISALNNLAWALATVDDASVQDANRAIDYAQRVCEMTGYREPQLLDTLAASYALAGRFEEAVTTAQKAIDAAKARGQEEIASKIERRLELYRAGKRYIQK
jgi:tetratricopeptide (TPR) repeat protein